MSAASVPAERPLTARLMLGLFGVGLFALGAVFGGVVLSLRPPVAGVPRETSSPTRWEATIYLPTKGNPGRPFGDEEWNTAVETLVKQFGGATLGPMMEGCWVNAAGHLIREPVRVVIISFEATRLDEFRTSLRLLGKRLGQTDIYVRFERVRIEVLAVPP